MSLAKTIVRCALLGAMIPVVARAAWPAIDLAIRDSDAQALLLNATLVVCPSWSFVLAGGGASDLVRVLLGAAAANGVLYAAVGALLWLGFHRHVAFLAAAAGAVIALWWSVLSL